MFFDVFGCFDRAIGGGGEGGAVELAGLAELVGRDACGWRVLDCDGDGEDVFLGFFDGGYEVRKGGFAVAEEFLVGDAEEVEALFTVEGGRVRL